MKLLRTRLYVPGNNPHLVENVGLYNADAVILDLEDSVPLGQKFDARILVKHSLQNVDFGRSERWVRINAPTTPYWKRDLKETLEFCEVVNVPKVEDYNDLVLLTREMERIERERKIEERKIVPIIETMRGLGNAREIAKHPRVLGLAWGGEDITADLGIPRKNALILDHIRVEILIASKSHGKYAFDTVYGNVRDMEGLYEYARKSRFMGFDGIGVIHPNQIEVVHNAFKPGEEEVEEAKRILEEAERAEKMGRGVVTINGRMVDRPVIERARRIISLWEVS